MDGGAVYIPTVNMIGVPIPNNLPISFIDIESILLAYVAVSLSIPTELLMVVGSKLIIVSGGNVILNVSFWLRVSTVVKLNLIVYYLLTVRPVPVVDRIVMVPIWWGVSPVAKMVHVSMGDPDI